MVSYSRETSTSWCCSKPKLRSFSLVFAVPAIIIKHEKGGYYLTMFLAFICSQHGYADGMSAALTYLDDKFGSYRVHISHSFARDLQCVTFTLLCNRRFDQA